MWNELIKYVIAFVFTVMCGIATTIVIPALGRWLRSKTNSEIIQYGINELSQTVITSVDYLEQTVVSELKNTEQWNADSQKYVLNMAVNTVINGLTKATKSVLEQGDIDATVKRYIEAYIQSKKKS
nr:MAG TPA: hypothetical protein [Caudoviricetes sp.]